MAKSRLHELAGRGQSVWFDTLSRELVHSGGLKRMMAEDAVTGVTSNPTIFQKALASGSAYDEDMRKLLAETDDPEQIFFSLALQDIRDAGGVLKPAFDGSGHRGGGRPLQPLREDPGDDGRPAGDRGLDRARHGDQHHADLLARAVQ